MTPHPPSHGRQCDCKRVAIGECDQRSGLGAQRMDDMAVVDDVAAAAAAARLGSSARQGEEMGCAEKGFDPVLVLADPQPPPDEPRGNGVEDTGGIGLFRDRRQQGGQEYATIRQDKEKLSQAELTLDQDRDTVCRNAVQFWGLNQASVGVIRAARASVAANEVALAGVREEAKVGQRTTLDVLNAQQALLQARSNLISAEHDAVVYSYSLLSAIGRLNAQTLNLTVNEYDPRVHFNRVKAKLWGVSTPDGK